MLVLKSELHIGVGTDGTMPKLQVAKLAELILARHVSKNMPKFSRAECHQAASSSVPLA